MLAKCNCNNCSTHLEFDPQNAGQSILCPKCGIETTLYLPPAPAAGFTKIKARQSPYAQRLRDIRSATCYRTYRVVLDITFGVCQAAVALACIVYVVFTIWTAESPSAGRVVAFVLACLVAPAMVIGILRAAHQAALLVADIADCNIRLVEAEEVRL
jgi:hypothetical protein